MTIHAWDFALLNLCLWNFIVDLNFNRWEILIPFENIPNTILISGFYCMNAKLVYTTRNLANFSFLFFFLSPLFKHLFSFFIFSSQWLTSLFFFLSLGFPHLSQHLSLCSHYLGHLSIAWTPTRHSLTQASFLVC